MLKLGQQQGHARCMRRRTVLSVFLILTIFMIFLLEDAEGARKKARPSRRTKKSRAGVGKDFSEFLLVIGAIMTCVIGPVFLYFIHSIYKDPAVPELARAGWKIVKNKLFSYLGGQQPVVPDSSMEPNNAHASPSALRTARRRNVDFNESDEKSTRINNDYTNTGDSSWASSNGIGIRAETPTLPPAAGIPVRYRPYEVRPDISARRNRRQSLRYTHEDDDYIGELPPYDFTRSDRRDFPRKVERGDERLASGGVAPYSSGTPPVEAMERELSIRGVTGNEEDAEFSGLRGVSPPTWKERRGDDVRLVSAARGAKSFGEEEAFNNFGQRWRTEVGPNSYLNSIGGKDAAHEPLGIEHQDLDVYKKGAQSKMRIPRSKRARAVPSSSTGEAGRYDGSGAERRVNGDG